MKTLINVSLAGIAAVAIALAIHTVTSVDGGASNTRDATREVQDALDEIGN